MARAARSIFAAVSALLLVACPSGPKAAPVRSPSPFAGKTPVQIFEAAIAEVRAAGSLRVVDNYEDGSTDVYDVGISSGRVSINEPPDVMEIRVVGGIAYAKGNADAMMDMIGASRSVARRYANRWIAYGRDDESYLDLTDSATLASFIDDIGFGGAIIVYAPSVVDNTKVVGLSGPLKIGGRGTLYVAAEGRPLPVQLTGTMNGAQLTVHFSRWGQPVDVSAPHGAIGASTVGL